MRTSISRTSSAGHALPEPRCARPPSRTTPRPAGTVAPHFVTHARSTNASGRAPCAGFGWAGRCNRAIVLGAILASAGCASAPPPQPKRPPIGYSMPVGLQQVRDDLGGIYFAPCDPCQEPSPKTPVLGRGVGPVAVEDAADRPVATSTAPAATAEKVTAAENSMAPQSSGTVPAPAATHPAVPSELPAEAFGERPTEHASQSVPLRPPSLVPDTQPTKWDVRTSDVSLAGLFARWASVAGFRLQWDVTQAYQYQITEPGTFAGTFESAVRQALYTPNIRLSDHPLEACAYPQSPPLVRVTLQGEQPPGCMVAWPTEVSANRWPDFGL